MICVSVAHINFDDLKSKLPDLEMLELRLDLLDFTDEQYQYLIEQKQDTIATFRADKASDEERMKALKNLIRWGVKYVDIEIDSKLEFIDEMVYFAQSYGCKVIISYHNFKETPSAKALSKVIQIAEGYQASYVKIATQAHSKTDVARILALYEHTPRLIAFCMGEVGKISRLSSLFLGADFTYASLSDEQSTACGQFDYQTLKNIRQTII